MDDVTATEHGIGIGPWACQLVETNERLARIEALLDAQRRQRAAERRRVRHTTSPQSEADNG